MRVDRLTFCLSYFENRQMLDEQVRTWLTWGPDILERMTFVICDDHSTRSPLPVAMLRQTGLDIRGYRIQRKVPWNIAGARNISVHEAPEGWCLITDMDHVVPADQMHQLFELSLDPRNHYRFNRLDMPNLEPIRPHSDTRVIRRSLYWSVGGSDESYVGMYKDFDGEFAKRLRAAGAQWLMLPLHVVRYEDGSIPDANTTDYGRKETRDAAFKMRVKAIQSKWTGPISLSFPYERVL